jgi:predicted DNA-binding transcriptional regulator AlpA
MAKRKEASQPRRTLDDFRDGEIMREKDIIEVGLANSAQALRYRIKALEFPPGRLISSNTRVWTGREVKEWFNTRPSGPNPVRSAITRRTNKARWDRERASA